MSEQVVSIREFRESDLSEWLRLRKMLWDQTSVEEHKAEMLDILDHHETQQVFVAESGSRLCGFLEVSIRPFVEDCHSDHVGYLEGWFVEPDLRKQNIGGRLVEAAERWARANDCTEMASDAEMGNELSLTAHLKLGYIETSRLIHLRKDL